VVLASDTLTLGIAGIAGTLLASLAGIGTTLWIERRKDVKEARTARRTSRLAARAVSTELVARKAEYRSLYDREVTMRDGVYQEMLAWQAHKDTLGAELGDKEFQKLGLAFARMEVYARGLPSGAVSPTMVQGVPDLLTALDEAWNSLRALASDD
jgi:hypothetical protein